jgi:chromosome segregation ATPase
MSSETPRAAEAEAALQVERAQRETLTRELRARHERIAELEAELAAREAAIRDFEAESAELHAWIDRLQAELVRLRRPWWRRWRG